MFTLRVFSILLLLLPFSICASDIKDRPKPKEMTFLMARGLLIDEDWEPVYAPERGSEKNYNDLEMQFLTNNIFELESCTKNTCILTYKKNTECIHLIATGNKIASMQITKWETGCRSLHPNLLERSWASFKSLFRKTT